MQDPITGCDGKITIGGGEVAHVLRFDINEEADNQGYTSSSCPSSDASVGKWQKTTAGSKKWSGTADVLLEAGADVGSGDGAALNVGQKYSGVFYTDASKQYSGDIRIDSKSGMEVDVEGSGNVGLTINFTGDGALTKP